MAQQQVRDDFLVEFLAMWALLDSTRLDVTGPGWVEAVMPLIRRYRLRSAQVSADYFERFSAVEAPAGPAPGRVEPPPRGRPAAPSPTRPTPARRQPARTPEPVRTSRVDTPQVAPRDRRVRFDFDESVFSPRIEGERRTRIEIPDIDWAPSDRAAQVSLTVTGPVGQKSKAARGKPLQRARDESFVEASGAATRHVLTGGRQSLLTLVEGDMKAIGWIRVTDGDPCAWCAMLASRGPVYRTEQSAGFSAHDACACQAEPVYSRDTLWPGRAAEFRRLYREVTTGTTGRDSINAFRRAYEQLQREARRADVA